MRLWKGFESRLERYATSVAFFVWWASYLWSVLPACSMSTRLLCHIYPPHYNIVPSIFRLDETDEEQHGEDGNCSNN